MPLVRPDLLRMADQTTAVTAATWPQRRDELHAAIIPHEYGGMPPAGESTRDLLLGTSTAQVGLRATYEIHEVRTRFAHGAEVSFLLNLWIPPGEGPFPVVLNGDGCWRYFDDRIVAQVLARGNIAASFNRTAVAADNKDIYRDTGIYRAVSQAEFGALSAWAWGYHRCVDVLTRLAVVRADQIAISGHSRGGKTVLLAGATDTRIALTHANDSGIGGSGLNRWKGAGSEVVDDFLRVGSIFWFGKGFADYRHRDRELPYDQHFLHGLVAPRGLLITEAYGDPGANPAGSYAACQEALRVYALLHAGDKLGWHVREGTHGHRPEDFAVLLDFMDLHFHGRHPVRVFQRPRFPDLEALLS